MVKIFFCMRAELTIFPSTFPHPHHCVTFPSINWWQRTARTRATNLLPSKKFGMPSTPTAAIGSDKVRSSFHSALFAALCLKPSISKFPQLNLSFTHVAEGEFSISCKWRLVGMFLPLTSTNAVAHHVHFCSGNHLHSIPTLLFFFYSTATNLPTPLLHLRLLAPFRHLLRSKL